jgi:hypothetical protein
MGEMVATAVVLVAATAVLVAEPDTPTMLVHTASAKQTHATRACERNGIVAPIERRDVGQSSASATRSS